MKAVEADPRTGPGRPRSAEADRAIVAAALELMREQGYADLSLEAVARAAGVGKATIYRRYHDKADLVAAALATVGGDVTAPIDTGDTRADLTELVRRFLGMMEHEGLPMVGSLLAERLRNPNLMDRFRERVIAPRRRLMRSLLERGVERGDVRAEADLELAVDTLIGPYFTRSFAGGAIADDWAERVVAAVWEGLAPRPGR